MIKKIGLLVGFLFFIGSISGQTLSGRDSLFNIWNDASAQDTVQLEALFQYINKYYSSNLPDSARILSELFYEKALAANAVKYQSKAKYLWGNAFMYLGQYEEAKNSLEKALQLSKQLDDQKGIALILNSLGIVNTDLANLDIAIEQLQQSMAINYQFGDSSRTTSNLLNIAAIYESKGEILTSLEYNKNALLLCKKYDKKRHLAIAHNNTANNYKFLGDVPKAAAHYLEALAIYDAEENAVGKTSTLNNLAVLLINNGNFQEANKYLQEAMKIAVDANIYPYQAVTYSNLASLYVSQGQLELAMSELQKGLIFIEKHGLEDMSAFMQLEMGRVLKSMGKLEEAKAYIAKGIANSENGVRIEDVFKGYVNMCDLLIEQERWGEAEEYAMEGLALAEKTQNLPSIADFSKRMVEINRHFGNVTEALLMYDKYVALRDSIYNEESNRSLLKQEYKYSYTQQAYQDSIANAATLALQSSDIKRRKLVNRFLWGILALLAIFAFVLFNRFQIIRQQKITILEEKEKAELANAKLQEIDQSKSRFFTNISHEFRTPLTVISGMIEQVKEQKYQTVRRLVGRNINQLLHLINQILDLRKLESGSLPVHYIQADVIKYLRYILESFQSLAEDRQITLDFQADKPAWILDYDPEKLLRIVSNLLANAIKFTPLEGEVKLSLNTTESESDPFYKFAVTDTGVGIPKEKLPYIFDRFYQVGPDSYRDTTRTGEGTGIGLTLSKELVDLMGGRIYVKTEEGHGTTFTVELPISHQAPVEQVQKLTTVALGTSEEVTASGKAYSDASQLSDTDKPRLMIVEDNPDVMEYLITCLGENYQLLFAYDGQEGLEKAIEEVPDIIISDVMMPRMDGFEMCNQLKRDERTSHIPLILLTAKADVESKITGLQRGADAYLVKPFDQRELIAQLNNLFHLRQQLQKRYSSLKNCLLPMISLYNRKMLLSSS